MEKIPSLGALRRNPGLVAISPTEALLIYSDFYVPDAEGVKRKSILCRRIKVKM